MLEDGLRGVLIVVSVRNVLSSVVVGCACEDLAKSCWRTGNQPTWEIEESALVSNALNSESYTVFDEVSRVSANDEQGVGAIFEGAVGQRGWQRKRA